MTSTVKKRAISSLLQKGCNASEISKQLGLPRSTVRYWIDKLSLVDTVKQISNDLSKATKDIDEQDISKFIEELSPIKVQFSTPSSKSVNGDYTVVIGDTHFGMEDKNTLEIFYNVLDELRPKNVIINGDTLDMGSVSKYPKDVRYNISLISERLAYHDFLSKIRGILGSDAIIYETNANHSGNGIEGRWWRYLSERLGVVASLPEVLESLTYKKVFIPDWADVKLVDNVEMCNGNLFIMHGDVVRKHGGYSARGMLDKWFVSTIMNHTHRMGMTSQRLPAIGSKGEGVITVYENGCACDLSPSYATAPNWQNGFSIICTDGDVFNVEQVIVQKNKAAVSTLGKVIVV